jgi:cyclase
MLCKRIIPTMLVRGRTLVKGERFDSWRSIGHAAQAAKVHARRGVDELMILDISATAEGRGPDLDLVRELSEGCFIPITVGGGVRSLADIDALLRAGADKVAIGKGWHEVPGLIRDAAARFGRQAIVGIVDDQQYGSWNHPEWACTNAICRKQAVMDCGWLAREGAGEILLQSVDRDGTMQGYDLETIREVSSAVSIPIIASGGCGTPEHMLEAFRAGADACAAGAMFAFSDETPKGVARYLKSAGVEMRL